MLAVVTGESGCVVHLEPLPAIVMVTSGIRQAKLVLFVHVYFKFVVQIGEALDWGSVGAVSATILCERSSMRASSYCGMGLWHLEVQCPWCP
eukprot:439696-Pelagomonas_calceolata.AAC.1